MKTVSLILLAGLLALLAGCVSVTTPERINVGSYNRVARIDSSRVPPTRDHAHAREKLAEAYARIRDLEDEVADLEEDKRELKRKLERYDD